MTGVDQPPGGYQNFHLHARSDYNALVAWEVALIMAVALAVLITVVVLFVRRWRRSAD